MNRPEPTATWMKHVLLAAGVYNLAWGLWVVCFPGQLFEWSGLEPPRYPQIWQCVGMVVGVYGIGYLIAAGNPLRHWPIVLVGLLGKIFGPLGFLAAAWRGDLPWKWGVTILTNDVIWWLPFAAILYAAFRFASDSARLSSRPVPEMPDALDQFVSQQGVSLRELSDQSPVLVVFLRHAGCTFCRQALADLSKQRPSLEAAGVEVALVHMGQEDDSDSLFQRYGWEQAHRFSDPECQLYRSFGLARGKLSQLFGLKVWWLGFRAAILEGHGFGRLQGDGFRMPGVFLLHRGRIVREYRHHTAADRPDYENLLCCPADPPAAGNTSTNAVQTAVR